MMKNFFHVKNLFHVYLSAVPRREVFFPPKRDFGVAYHIPEIGEKGFAVFAATEPLALIRGFVRAVSNLIFGKKVEKRHPLRAKVFCDSPAGCVLLDVFGAEADEEVLELYRIQMDGAPLLAWRAALGLIGTDEPPVVVEEVEVISPRDNPARPLAAHYVPGTWQPRTKQEAELLDLLEEVAGTGESMAVSAVADAMRMLAMYGRLVIESDDGGRMVKARPKWMFEEENNG